MSEQDYAELNCELQKKVEDALCHAFDLGLPADEIAILAYLCGLNFNVKEITGE